MQNRYKREMKRWSDFFAQEIDPDANAEENEKALAQKEALELEEKALEDEQNGIIFTRASVFQGFEDAGRGPGHFGGANHGSHGKRGSE